MDGGGCEATAFGAFGYRAVGLCMPLRYHHNRGNLDEFEMGLADPVPMYEEISLDDFHGLIDLIVLSVEAIDQDDPLPQRLGDLYESRAHYLGLE